MKRWFLVLAALPVVTYSAPPLQCNIGPVMKVFGSVPWLVYSCNDASSVVLVSAPGSPATPFYFFFSLQGTTYKLRGEGTGSKAVTGAALKDLQALSPDDIRRLRAETITAKKP
jgi:hypothetical protein